VAFGYQAEIHQSTKRFRVVDGGRRIGKSQLGGREAFAQCVIPGSMVWVVGPSMDLAEKEFRVVWKLTVDDGWIPIRRKSERELFIQFENGSMIECRSEENPDQLIGEGLDLVILAEAARLKQRTWDQYIRPALADRQGRALLTSTPRGFNWFYDFYNKGTSEESDHNWWQSWMIPSSANPILPPEEIEEARKNTTPEAFAQEWEAKFIAYGGLVYPEFDENIHVAAQSWNPSLRTSLWVDPGMAAPYCVLLVQITPEEQVFVLDEIYRTGQTTAQIIRQVEDKWSPYLFNDFGNPSDMVEVVVDKAAAEAVATWRLRGYRTRNEKPTSIKRGIEVHHMFLRDPIRSIGSTIVPRIMYDPKCKMAIKEYGQYHYPDAARKRVEANSSENPVDVDNHAMDALRYGFFNFFPELFNEQIRGEELVQYENWNDVLPPELFGDVSLGAPLDDFR
jgi:Terminase large subunit, T4likevirus-type, N-terminal